MSTYSTSNTIYSSSLPVDGLLRDSFWLGEVLELLFNARISWLRRALFLLPDRGGAFPPDAVLALDVGGVAFLPEDLMENGVSEAESGPQ